MITLKTSCFVLVIYNTMQIDGAPWRRQYSAARGEIAYKALTSSCEKGR